MSVIKNHAENVVNVKKRRIRRKHYNWEKEIINGNTNKFYNSTDWEIVREKVLERDNYECQFFSGKWNDGKHLPSKIVPIRATMVHHIIPIKVRPDLALDMNNMISLSFEAHEIIEERNRWSFRKKKKILTVERW